MSSHMPLTDNSFRYAWNVLYSAILKWEQADGPLLNGRKAITIELQDAIERAINVTADINRAGERRELKDDCLEWVILFDLLAKSYREYKTSVLESLSKDEIESDGSVAMWRAITTLRDYGGAKYNYAPPQPIRDLRLQGVSDHQIAMMYGWVDEDGNADLLKVSEESEHPGRHFNPAKWEHPALKGRRRLAKEAIEGREPRKCEYFSAEEPENFGVSAVPSIEELCALDAPPEQIARLHKISLADAAMHLQIARSKKKPTKKESESMQSKLVGVDAQKQGEPSPSNPEGTPS